MDRLFGKPGSQYDFSTVDVNRLKDKARELESQQKGMKKKINPKVITMIDRWAPLMITYRCSDTSGVISTA